VTVNWVVQLRLRSEGYISNAKGKKEKRKTHMSFNSGQDGVWARYPAQPETSRQDLAKTVESENTTQLPTHLTLESEI
jgi:hypothetical protein